MLQFHYKCDQIKEDEIDKTCNMREMTNELKTVVEELEG
jgi:hypothetical protein